MLYRITVVNSWLIDTYRYMVMNSSIMQSTQNLIYLNLNTCIIQLKLIDDNNNMKIPYIYIYTLYNHTTAYPIPDESPPLTKRRVIPNRVLKQYNIPSFNRNGSFLNCSIFGTASIPYILFFLILQAAPPPKYNPAIIIIHFRQDIMEPN